MAAVPIRLSTASTMKMQPKRHKRLALRETGPRRALPNPKPLPSNSIPIDSGIQPACGRFRTAKRADEKTLYLRT